MKSKTLYELENPVLKKGELAIVVCNDDCLDADEYRVKIGDGEKAFNALPYGVEVGAASWNTLADRPFYEEVMKSYEVTCDRTVTSDGNGSIDNQCEMYKGNTYKITINDEVFDDVEIIHGLHGDMGADFGKYSYGIVVVDGGSWITGFEPNTEYHIKVERIVTETVIKPIPPKFMPTFRVEFTYNKTAGTVTANATYQEIIDKIDAGINVIAVMRYSTDSNNWITGFTVRISADVNSGNRGVIVSGYTYDYTASSEGEGPITAVNLFTFTGSKRYEAAHPEWMVSRGTITVTA